MVTNPDAAEYTVIKEANGRMWYGIEAKAPDNHGRILYVLEDTPYDPEPGEQHITFVKYGEDLESDALTKLTHKRTITFDIDAAGYGLAVYKDWGGKTRIRMGHNSLFPIERRFGGLTSLPEKHDFVDLKIHHQNTSATDNGRSLLLDRLNNKMWIVEFNHKQWLMLDKPAEIKMEKSLDLGELKNPQGFTLNDDMSRAYVVNRGDETISVLALTNEDGTVKDIPQIVATVDLAGQVPDKTLAFEPNGIHFKDGYLFVSCEGIRGEIVVETAAIQENEL